MAAGLVLALSSVNPIAQTKKKTAKRKPARKRSKSMARKKTPPRNKKGRFMKKSGKRKSPKRSYKKKSNPKRKAPKRSYKKKSAKRKAPKRSYKKKGSKKRSYRKKRNPAFTLGGLDVTGMAAFGAAVIGTEYLSQTLFGPRYRHGIVGALTKAGTAYGLAMALKSAKIVSAKTAKGIELAGLAHAIIGVTAGVVMKLPRVGPFLKGIGMGERQYRLNGGMGERQYRLAGAQRPAHLGGTRQAYGRGLPRHLRAA